MQPVPFEIIGRAATNGTTTIALDDDGGRMFKRRAMKGVGTGDPQHVEWLVVELDNVRVYVAEGSVVVSRQDLMP